MIALDIVTVITNQNINRQFKELAWLLSIYKTVYKVSYKPIVEATPMASILDQYEEESARATSISSVTPIQIPVSSNFAHLILKVLLQLKFWNKLMYQEITEFFCLTYIYRVSIVAYAYMYMYAWTNILLADWPRLHRCKNRFGYTDLQ